MIEETGDVDACVWLQPGAGPAWMDGGSYMVTRKIAMRIETWDREPLEVQERIIGRAKGMGGPMSGGDGAAAPDFGATDKTTGAALIGPMAHVRLADPNDGAKLLRRGYNFVDGSNGLGQLAAGLFFTAFQRDPVGRSSRSNARWPARRTTCSTSTSFTSAQASSPVRAVSKAMTLGEALFA